MPNIVLKIAIFYEIAETDRQATFEWDSRLISGGISR
jgi:hypothetical protein